MVTGGKDFFCVNEEVCCKTSSMQTFKLTRLAGMDEGGRFIKIRTISEHSDKMNLDDCQEEEEEEEEELCVSDVFVQSRAFGLNKNFRDSFPREFLSPCVFFASDDRGTELPSIPLNIFFLEHEALEENVMLQVDAVKVFSRVSLRILNTLSPHFIKIVNGDTSVSPTGDFVVQVKPGQLLDRLKIQLVDEAGMLCEQLSSSKEEEEDVQLVVSCSWGEDFTVKREEYQGEVPLPCLKAPTHEHESVFHVRCSLEEKEMATSFKVVVETGAPAQLKVQLDDENVRVGRDCSLKLSVLDERGANVVGGGDQSVSLDKFNVFVTDERSRSFPVLVRKENYAQGSQIYTQFKAMEAERDEDGSFWLRCIRLRGMAGRVEIHVEAMVELEDEDCKQYRVRGACEAQLGVGKAEQYLLQGSSCVRKMSSQLGGTQLEEVVMKGKAFNPLESLLLEIVDESQNVVGEHKSKVMLDFSSSSLSRFSVVSSKKPSGLSADSVLLFDKLPSHTYEIAGLTFLERGSHSAVIRSSGLPDLPLRFDIDPANIVRDLSLTFASSALTVGQVALARLELTTEDEEELDFDLSHTISILSSGEQELPARLVSRSRLTVDVEIEMPKQAGTLTVYAVYSEIRDSFLPRPADVESSRTRVELCSSSFARLELVQEDDASTSVKALQDGALLVPELLVCATDAFGNRCELGERIVQLAVKLKSRDGLMLEGPKLVSITAQENPVKVKDLRVVPRTPREIDICEFNLCFSVKSDRREKASGDHDTLEVPQVVKTFTYSNDVSIVEKIEECENRERALKSRQAALHKSIQEAQARIAARRSKVAEAEEEEDLSEKLASAREKLKGLEQEWRRAEQSCTASSSLHDVNLEELEGVVGVAADLGVIDRLEGVSSERVSRCLTAAFKGLLCAVLFRKEEDLNAFDALPLEVKARAKVRRVYCSARMMDPPRPKRPSSPGFVSFAADLVQVSPSVREEDRSCARVFLNTILANLLIFESYEQAVKYSTAMMLQRKRAGRLVGLDRPNDVIDSDGGRNVNLGGEELRICFGILPARPSTWGKELLRGMDAGRAEVKKLEEMVNSEEEDKQAIE
eukprot:752775-Hanusia_phi.AAC.3